MQIYSRLWWGKHLLRLTLAAVFLWFGFSQLTNSLAWVGLVPDWATNLVHIPPAMIVLGNGTFEVVLASLLAMGFFVRTISFLLALHLLPIAFSFLGSATGVRDFGLAFSSFALSLLYTKDVVIRQETVVAGPSRTSTYKAPDIYPHIPNKN